MVTIGNATLVEVQCLPLTGELTCSVPLVVHSNGLTVFSVLSFGANGVKDLPFFLVARGVVSNTF